MAMLRQQPRHFSGAADFCFRPRRKRHRRTMPKVPMGERWSC